MMSRRGRIRWISYAVALALVLGVALAACHVGAGGYTTRIDAQSTRAFGEALSAVERLDRSLQKCAFASGSAMESTVCAQIYSDAQSAQTALSTLPVELDALEAISRHISTVGDYAFALSRAAAEGQSFSSEELERLSDFEKTTDTLYEQLSQLRQDYQDGAVISEYFDRLTDSLDNLASEAKSTADTLDSALHELARSFPDTVPIVYDGAYSDHSADQPTQLMGREEVTQEEARTIAAAFLDISESALEPLQRADGEIPCWRFAANGTESATIAITVQGGEVLRYLSDHVENADVDHEKAVETAKSFLSRLGFPNMEAVDAFPSAGAETLTMVPVQDGVYCLPDSITIKICPESGKVTGFNAENYLSHHSERDLAPFDTPFDVSAALPAGTSVLSQRNIILHSPGGQELFCVEAECQSADGALARISVNVESGRQERILLEGERDPSVN